MPFKLSIFQFISKPSKFDWNQTFGPKWRHFCYVTTHPYCGFENIWPEYFAIGSRKNGVITRFTLRFYNLFSWFSLFISIMSYVKIDKETWRQCALYIFIMNVKFIDCLNLTEHGVWKSLEMSHLHSINLELGCLRGQRPTFCLVILLQKKLEIESQNNSLFREVWQQKKRVERSL